MTKMHRRPLQREKKESVIRVPGESGQEETNLNRNRKIHVRLLDFFSQNVKTVEH